MGFLIKNKFINKYGNKGKFEIKAIDNRNMCIHLGLNKQLDLVIFNTHSHRAGIKTTGTKQIHYDNIQKYINDHGKQHMYIITGDFNARIIDNIGYEDIVGQHIYKQGLNDHMELEPNQFENRNIFLELCLENDLIVKNTTIQKDDIDKHHA